MAHSQKKPDPLARAGLSQITKSLDSFSNTAPEAFRQAPIAVRRLTRRFGLTPSTAVAVAELAGIGGAP